ncbi:hypothetical protein ARMGADRAFT_1027583 [Armillaria gallica]|uniref:Uncharacterized protein n=1 Tax=Armillaria gallica TaxID=47427 RepID=A0A2H3DMS9_ARMGA|nr:hypothetical protein ARMGADRAFT_1027583 [Armillaria gallica]
MFLTKFLACIFLCCLAFSILPTFDCIEVQLIKMDSNNNVSNPFANSLLLTQAFNHAHSMSKAMQKHKLLVDTQFKYQLGLAKSLSDSKSNSIALKSVASALLDYLLHPNLHSLWTLFHNPILGLQLKGDVADSFAKAHILHGPPVMQVTFVYLACP